MGKKKLPTELEFQLMNLVIRERPGREVAKLYHKATGKRISPGSLYTTFRRLRDDTGWIRYRDEVDGDGRIRHIKLTAKGATALNRAREHFRDLADFGVPEVAGRG